MDARTHWNKVYQTKRAEELSWTQAVPAMSLAFIDSFGLSRDARIIDIGGGESRLAGFLLERGFRNITVLDISSEAIARSQEQLGERAALVEWIVADVTAFEPRESYDVWHDRATFHFLTTPPQLSSYLSHARSALPAGGYLLIGTFSDSGPDSCSGLPVRRYDEAALTRELDDGFDKIGCVTEDHETPFRTVQNFLFCSFRRG